MAQTSTRSGEVDMRSLDIPSSTTSAHDQANTAMRVSGLVRGAVTALPDPRLDFFRREPQALPDPPHERELALLHLAVGAGHHQQQVERELALLGVSERADR